MADRERPAIRPATLHDRAAIAAMLGRAFADDPAMTYIFPGPADRAKRLPRLFALLFDSDGPVGMRLVAAGVEGATLWRGPGRSKTGVWEMMRHAPAMASSLGGSIGRALTVANAIDAHHPSSDFWYLHVAGCDPEHQGKGIGGALIRDGLARANGLSCYLETATERNLGLYRSLGFEVTGDWRVPRGGPRFWSMVRPSNQ